MHEVGESVTVEIVCEETVAEEWSFVDISLDFRVQS
jgi:hypothetical protein